jgi:hypothetical protein
MNGSEEPFGHLDLDKGQIVGNWHSASGHHVDVHADLLSPWPSNGRCQTDNACQNKRG